MFWMCSLLVSAATLLSTLFLTARKFASFETFLERFDEPIATGEIPFPAITICPDSLVFENIFELGKKSANFTDDE